MSIVINFLFSIFFLSFFKILHPLFIMVKTETSTVSFVTIRNSHKLPSILTQLDPLFPKKRFKSPVIWNLSHNLLKCSIIRLASRINVSLIGLVKHDRSARWVFLSWKSQWFTSFVSRAWMFEKQGWNVVCQVNSKYVWWLL